MGSGAVYAVEQVREPIVQIFQHFPALPQFGDQRLESDIAGFEGQSHLQGLDRTGEIACLQVRLCLRMELTSLRRGAMTASPLLPRARR